MKVEFIMKQKKAQKIVFSSWFHFTTEKFFIYHKFSVSTCDPARTFSLSRCNDTKTKLRLKPSKKQMALVNKIVPLLQLLFPCAV